jgi:coiled-coil domain-containing protein 12
MTDPGEAPKRKIKFRNYKPYDSSLVADAGSAKTEEPAAKVAKIAEDAVIQQIEVPTEEPPSKPNDPIQAALSELQGSEEEINIVPKKPNWDLKSQIEDKLERLRKRTQRSIVEILREKLSAEGQQEEGDGGYSDDDGDEIS